MSLIGSIVQAQAAVRTWFAALCERLRRKVEAAIDQLLAPYELGRP